MSPRPTADEMLALEAICQPGGSMASAAAELGVSILAIHKRLLRLYGRLDRADTSEMHGPTADVDIGYELGRSVRTRRWRLRQGARSGQ